VGSALGSLLAPPPGSLLGSLLAPLVPAPASRLGSLLDPLVEPPLGSLLDWLLGSLALDVDAAAELESAVLDADELDAVELDSGELDAVAVLDPLGAGEGWLSAAVAGPMTTRTVTSAAVMAKAVRGYRPIRTLTTPSWLVSPTTRGADRPPGINHICLINAPEQPIRGKGSQCVPAE
jgi:hypothetical protein